MRTLWIGLRESEFLCGSEHGRETIERMRERGALIRFGTTALQAIRYDGRNVGYGLVCSVHPDGPVAMDSEMYASTVERVRRAFGMRGIGGKFSINLEETDMPLLPTRVSS